MSQIVLLNGPKLIPRKRLSTCTSMRNWLKRLEISYPWFLSKIYEFGGLQYWAGFKGILYLPETVLLSSGTLAYCERVSALQ